MDVDLQRLVYFLLIQTHNLGVAPEMIWLKSRDSAENWQVDMALVQESE